MRERLLVRHFLQQFLDHDLLSPHVDRRQVLTVTCAMVVSSSLFLAVFLAVKYQFNLFMPPGPTAVFALDDRFFFVSLSMILMGLLAGTEWDALALDARDTSVLGHLPLPRRVVVRAKFTAVALFAVGFVVAWNLGPTIVRPAALPAMLPVTVAGALTLMAAHALITAAAGGFAFVAVLGIREMARAILGARFRRVSGVLQAVLILFFVAALLLVPGSYAGVARFWLKSARLSSLANPALWFVGLHEMLAGGVIDRLPRTAVAPRMAGLEREATLLYRGLEGQFHDLAMLAVMGSAIVAVAAVGACAWNHRRWPLPEVPIRRSSRPRTLLAALMTRVVVRQPASQAGFFFTLQSLSRSVPHRMAMATSAAVGFAGAVVILSRNPVRVAPVPVPLLAMQTLLIAALLVGFRHAVRIPAELKANWIFQLSWSGDERPFLAGAKRAAFLALVAPLLAVLFVWYAAILGTAPALEHLACGVLVALLLMEALFFDVRKLPFASSYAPGEGVAVKALSAVFLLAATFMFAWVERNALATTIGTLALLGSLTAVLLRVHAMDAAGRLTRIEIDLDELPADATQRLGLVR